MKNKTLVFTATYNEAGNIEKFLGSTNNPNSEKKRNAIEEILP